MSKPQLMGGLTVDTRAGKCDFQYAFADDVTDYDPSEYDRFADHDRAIDGLGTALGRLLEVMVLKGMLSEHELDYVYGDKISERIGHWSITIEFTGDGE
jgi:hypothetical protein